MRKPAESHCSELFKEAHVVLVEETEVVYVIASHYHTLKTETECKARILLRVDAAVLQHLGVYHACAEKLYIALVLAHGAAFSAAVEAADIYLTAGLGEWEVVRTETELAVVAVELLHKHFECALEVAHCDALVNYETLYLVEERGVSSVNSVRTEYSAG